MNWYGTSFLGKLGGGSSNCNAGSALGASTQGVGSGSCQCVSQRRCNMQGRCGYGGSFGAGDFVCDVGPDWLCGCADR